MATSVKPEGTTTTVKEPLDEARLASRVARLVNKNKGDVGEAVELVLSENANYRERHRLDTETLRARDARIKELEGLVPGKEDVVLKGDEAKAYKGLAEVKTTAQEVTELRTFKTHAERVALMKTAGEKVGYDPDVLADLLGMRGVKVVMKEVTTLDPKDKSKTIKDTLPHVQPITDDKAEPMLLTDYVDKHLKLYEQALRKDASGSTSRKGRTTDGRSEGTFTAFPAQSSASKGNTGAQSPQDVVKSVDDSMGFALPSDLTKSNKQE